MGRSSFTMPKVFRTFRCIRLNTTAIVVIVGLRSDRVRAYCRKYQPFITQASNSSSDDDGMVLIRRAVQMTRIEKGDGGQRPCALSVVIGPLNLVREKLAFDQDAPSSSTTTSIVRLLSTPSIYPLRPSMSYSLTAYTTRLNDRIHSICRCRSSASSEQL